MKYWQKTFLCTLALFILALDVGTFLLFRAAYATAIETERERGFSEHAFLTDTLSRDLTIVLSRENSASLVGTLFYSYAAYYRAQGMFLALSDGDGSFSNLPETPPDHRCAVDRRGRPGGARRRAGAG